jgi:uncharacterized cupin superfamily protein
MSAFLLLLPTVTAPDSGRVNERPLSAPSTIRAGSPTVEPGASSGPKPMEHPGEELILMLDGTLTFEIEGEQHVLRRGDALHFRTDRPHRWANPGKRPARAAWMALRSS